MCHLHDAQHDTPLLPFLNVVEFLLAREAIAACFTIATDSRRNRGIFFAFWTRVAITALRRPELPKRGPKVAWFLGAWEPTGCGFWALIWAHLARQHVRCGAHFCPFQGPKRALLGGRSDTRV